MRIKKTKFQGLVVLNGTKHQDQRGYLRELVIEKLIKKKFKFQITSLSKKNVLRGLHFQKRNAQGKYISVLKGKIFDVAVDCRKNSKTFGKHFKIVLSAKNSKSIFIPPGFAHGFVGLKDENVVLYSCTNYRDKQSESGIMWNDPYLKIKWPINKPMLSAKDKKNKFFKFYFS